MHFCNEWMRAEDFGFQGEIGYIYWYFLKSRDGWMNTDPKNDNDDVYTRDYANYLMSDITRNGSDAFGFSLLPAGWRSLYKGYVKEGRCAAFWTSDEESELVGDHAMFDDDEAYIANYFCDGFHDEEEVPKDSRASVRCVKD